MRKRALITGITGQDGSYLAELLLSKGYEVHGVVRRVAIEDPDHRLNRIQHLLGQVTLHAASLESHASIHGVIEKVQPEECYHLAAQSYVAYSFDDEFSTLNTNINGTHYVLAALKRLAPKCKFYFAGSSEMFGAVHEIPQTETTRFRPRSCYGISKVAGYELTRNYREAYGLHASSGILFNHESPRRETPDDYVISTGDTRSVQEFASLILIGDCSKAKQQLNWESRIGFPELVHDMVTSDLLANGVNPSVRMSHVS
jgi:GDPmannose 4,6-dehydratase